MRESWLSVVARVLRPSRPLLERCSKARERHLTARRGADERKARAMADVVLRIESARAEVFAAQDGVVTRRMTDLEREWRLLSRRDRDQNLMDLWAEIAPRAWIDRKPWRDSPPASQLDAAVALASDPEGVTEAERAIAELLPRARVRWRAAADDVDATTDLLVEPLDSALDTLSSRDGWSSFVDRARDLEREIHEAALVDLPHMPRLVRSISYAAFVDEICRGAGVPSPAAPLRAVWSTGYIVIAIDASSVTLGF